ncbi:hypothetical protein LSUE1_G004567 [Lachnellula suecica]|uniref:DUF6594 domain-containing protein n=1 Tax=Lachnellula suecica TaxID=602035 RepID=A0A8T9C9U3_9HELO|nr:hypothetical protein LSUE1_G004567 [Lachnellula suecica]
MSGYTKLATFMTDRRHTILKKYQRLAARDLLYLQAELCELEFQYDSIAKRDAAEKDERQYYDRDWKHLKTSGERGFGGEQWAVAIEIRAKLREYYSAITQYSQIAAVPQPKPSERTVLHEWITSASLGGDCGFLGRDLGGFDHLPPSIYHGFHQEDLAILSDSHGENDLFTKFITGPVLTSYHWFRQHTKTPLAIDLENPPVGENRSNLHYYPDNHIETVTNVLGTILSSLAPLVSIVVLSFVTNPKARLGLVCLFTILFSSCLAIATRSRRVEIFAATAAFASVQVVFIGSSNDSNI